MYKLGYFMPKEAIEITIQALFDIGVGRYENIKKVQEYKVEMICKAELIKEAIEALKRVHPYENNLNYAHKLDFAPLF